MSIKYVAPGIQLRKKRLYAVQEIPKALRKKLGRSRFVQSLGTDSVACAKRRAAPLIAGWKRQIEQAKGEPNDDAAFYREALRKAQTDAERQTILDEIELAAQSTTAPAYPDNPSPEAVADIEGAIHETQQDYYDRATGAVVGLADHLQEWLDQSGVQPRTAAMRRTDVARFAQRVPMVHDVTRKKVQLWIQLLSQQGYKPATIRKSLQALRGYWKWLQAHELAPAIDPFAGLQLPKNGKDTAKRLPFTAADVRKLIDASEGTLRDLIMLAAYTGCRIEELCSLKVKDVHTDHFSITSGKTDAAIREVPIHPELQQTVARLLDESTDGYLLSGLSQNAQGQRSNAIGHSFSKLKASLGYDSRYVFHSLRKTVATQLEEAGVAEVVAARILGHQIRTMSYGTYSGGVSLSVKADALGSISYAR